MPYCDVDLTPHWDYDLEKAILLSCKLETALVIGLGVGLSCVALFAASVAVVFMKKSKSLEAKYVMSKSAVEA